MRRRSFLSGLLATLAAPTLLRGVGTDGSLQVRNARRLPPVDPRSFTVEGPHARFFVLGDFGTGGSLQRSVATAMATWADTGNDLTGMISTGDNIYPSGVSSATDPQWAAKFSNVYAAPSLQKPWWAVLGNHDHRGSVTAQIERGTLDPLWRMPAQWWSATLDVPDPISKTVTNIRLMGLDTQVLMKNSAERKRQLDWFTSELRTTRPRWTIVIGHHPLRSYGHYGDQTWLLDLIKKPMDANDVPFYCCGHDHDLQIIKHPDDSFRCLVSGAGGGGRSTAFGEHTEYAATNGGFLSLALTPSAAHIHAIDARGTLAYGAAA
jgi:acid phosphatase